ncbi:MAG TPA: hypothetical protein VFA29_14610 [Candidatus Baltobacteraceae bacterium]|nr:hypothetical protein [Candidatus Baltobacteraceae bacterium]
MHKFTKIAAALAAASLLAACGGQSGSVPATNTAPSSTHQAAGGGNSAFTRLTSTGVRVPIFPMRNQFTSVPGSFTPSNNLQYGGGPVQLSPKVYLVLWGKQWLKGGGGDPDHARPYLVKFLKGLNGSQWTSTLTQYYGPPGHFIQNTTTLAGQWVDTTDPLPAEPDQTQWGNEAGAAAKHFNDTSVNASYVVAVPTGHGQSVFNMGACAYHWVQSVNGATVSWTALPYMPDFGSSCGAGFVNNPGTLDGVTIVEGHEQGETETDPQPFSGWNGPLGEIGDACAWQNLQNTKFSTGTFPTQPLWSNKISGCAQ